jgi:hypothetical protein
MERRRLTYWQMLLIPVSIGGILILAWIFYGDRTVLNCISLAMFVIAVIVGWREIGRWG